MNQGVYQPSVQRITPPRAVGGVPARPMQIPGGIDGSSDWRRADWPAAQDSIYATVRAAGWTYGTRQSAATITAVSNNYVGTVLAPGGLVWATPFAATGGLVFDSNNNRTYVVGSFGGGTNFISGVLLNDGRVFVIPRSSTTARIVDLTNNTVTTPGGTFAGGNIYVGGCLFDGGRKIYLAPALQSTATIYDLQRQSLSTPSGTFTFTAGGINATAGAMLLPDGRIFLAPCHTSAAIYDPLRDSLFISSLALGYNGAANPFFGAVLLPNGDEIALIPQNGTAVAVYNWRRDTARNVSGSATGFLGGQLAPDGTVFMVPNAATAARYYSPSQDAHYALPDVYSGSSPAAGANVLPDGRLVMMPRSDSAVRTYGTRGTAVEPNPQLSPFFNHR